MLGVLKDVIIIKDDDVTLYIGTEFLVHYFYEYSLKWERYVKFHFKTKTRIISIHWSQEIRELLS